MSAAEVANTAWGAARAGVRHNPLMSALATAAARHAASHAFTTQGIANVAWAFTKLQAPNAVLFAELARAATRLLRGGPPADGRSLAELAWAFSPAPNAELNAAICFSIAREPARLMHSCVAGLLQSFGGARKAGELAPGVDAAVFASLGDSALANIAQATAQDLGLLAGSLARAELQLSGERRRAVSAALAARAVIVAAEMDWRGVAATELALRRLRAGRGAGRGAAMRALAQRAGAAALEVAEAADAAQAHLQSLMLSVISSVSLPGEARVLLAGEDPAGRLTHALIGRGWTVQHWRRFVCEEAAPNAPEACGWPPPSGADDGFYDAVFQRMPPAAEWRGNCGHSAAAVECRLRPGGLLYLAGRVDECIASAPLALERAFSDVSLVAESADGARLLRAIRRDTTAARSELHLWRMEIPPLPFPGATAGGPPFVSYPGFFAAGGLDIMTRGLLAHLANLPLAPHALVLDFAAGSGALAAGLLAREPSLRCTLLDADALAIAAARENVPCARHILLSDGWSGLQPVTARFDLIVSNPPVHAGTADEFRVLQRLLEGAPSRMLAGASLWLVAQAQVPVGRLASGICGLSKMKPTRLDGGRFIAWHAMLA